MKIWISALIPRQGADVYEGVRLQVSLSESDCYRDLGEWLTDSTDWEYEEEDGVADDFDLETATVQDIEDALDDARDQEYIRLWKVETQEVEAVRENSERSGHGALD